MIIEFIQEHLTIWIITYIIMIFLALFLKELLPDAEDPRNATIAEGYIPKKFFFSLDYGYGILTWYCVILNVVFLLIMINVMHIVVKSYIPDFPTDWFADFINI